MIRTARVLRSPRRPTALAKCLLAALLLPGAGAADQERLRAAPRAVTGTPAALEMTLGPGVPVIEGRIGGKTLRLIVDTGATWSMLTPEAARAAGLATQPAGDLIARDAAGEQKTVEAAHVETLELPADGDGVITMSDFHVVVMDSPLVERAGVDGILGLPLLRLEVVTFDFPAGRLEIGGDDLPATDGERILPLRSGPGGLVTARAVFEPELDGAPEVFVVDTGFSGAIHVPGKAARTLAGEAPATRSGSSATAHEERDFAVVEVQADLLLGEHRIQRPRASVFMGNASGRPGRAAIGTDLLKRFRITLDFPRRRLRLEEAEQGDGREPGPTGA